MFWSRPIRVETTDTLALIKRHKMTIECLSDKWTARVWSCVEERSLLVTVYKKTLEEAVAAAAERATILEAIK